MKGSKRTIWASFICSERFSFLLIMVLLLTGVASVPLSRGSGLDPRMIHVGNDFETIQEAINNANAGDTIYVSAGIYYERVIVNKTVSLIGENNTAVIDGSGSGTVVEITASGVSISGFRIQNSGYGWMNHGVYVDTADNCTISNNLLQNNCHTVKLNYSRNSQVIDNLINGTMFSPTMYGIRIENSTNCTVTGNDVSDCVGAIHLQNATDCIVSNNSLHGNSQGIRMYSPCVGNRFFGNMVRDGTYDGMIDNSFGGVFLNNSLFHNTFINNTNPFIYKASGFSWDDGYPSGGNHWSRYNGTDSYKGVYQNETDYDGIGDTHYQMGDYDKDRYPLMHPYGSIRNLNTNLTYLTIRSAVDSNATLNGHVLFIKSGIYKEHLTIDKAISIVGEDQASTAIDGENTGTIVTVKADNVSIAELTISNSGMLFPPYGNDCGVLLDHCASANVSHNLMTNNRIGIYSYYSYNNIIEHNTVHSNQEDGILLWYSGNNALTGNTILNNSHNFGVYGQDFPHFNNSIDQSNLVNGKPVHYLVGIGDTAIENQADVSVLYLINCVNVTVRNMEFTNNAHGIFCFNVTSSRIENVTASHNGYGIALQNSAKNSVRRNYCSANWVGLVLQDANDNDVESNTVVGGEKGISLYEADNNTLAGNTIVNATFGIRLYSSSFNKVFHNNLIENVEQVSILSGSYENTWDDGIEGNYWSDYTGQDSDKDGLGDDYRSIDSQNRDNHPLAGVFYAFEAFDSGTFHYVAVITNSTILDFAYEEPTNTIRLIVSGSEQTFGFCRIRVPHALLESELTVIIDDGLTEVLHANYTLLDDGSSRWIYFAYPHSLREIVVVYEFQALILWLIVVSLLWVLPRMHGENVKH